MPRSVVLCLLLGLIACGEDADTDAPQPESSDITPAVPIAQQNPIPYPPALYAQGIEGEVMLYLFVDASGAVIHDSTRIAESSGHNEFDAAALQAAPSLRFVPAHRGDSAVSAPIQVPIRFTLPDSAQVRADS